MTYDPDEFHFFWGGPFSQWKKSNFDWNGVTFSTAEQAMMHSKALLFDDLTAASLILQTRDPGKQKALGRKVSGFDEMTWDSRKQEIVREINYAKFFQNKGLRRKLFQTYPKRLVEASPHDVIWGIGLDEMAAKETQPELWPGKNLLGQIITAVRDELKSEFHGEFEQIVIS